MEEHVAATEDPLRVGGIDEIDDLVEVVRRIPCAYAEPGCRPMSTPVARFRMRRHVVKAIK